MDLQTKNNITGFKRFRKFLPFVFLALLTVALMFFFKYKKLDKIIEEGKNSLLALYSENLKPLLFQTQISEEDIFNFALFQTLPLDKERNRVLVISNDQPGNQEFVIKPAGYNSSTKNYETFVRYLGMNSSQKSQADSILNSYKQQIYSSVLADNKNTVAVNPKLGELQQAVLADLVSFADKVNEEKTKILFPKMLAKDCVAKFKDLITSAREIPQSDYLLITPDTAARTQIRWDESKFRDQFKEMEKNKNMFAFNDAKKFDYNYNIEPMHGTAEVPAVPNVTFKADSNFFKVVVPIDAMHLDKMIQDTLRIKLNEVARKLKNISINFGGAKSKSPRSTHYIVPPVPPSNDNVEINIPNPMEIVNQTFKALNLNSTKGWEDFGRKMDSLTKSGNIKAKDSLKQKMKEEMLKLKKQLKKDYANEN